MANEDGKEKLSSPGKPGSVKEFLSARSGQRDRDHVTIAGRKIPLQSVTFRERNQINLMWYEPGKGDTREDARELRAALMLQKAIVEEDGQRAFTDSEYELQIILNLRSQDCDAFDEKVREMNFAKAEDLGKNLPAAKTTGSS